MSISTARAYFALGIGILSIAWSAIFVRWVPIPGTASALYRVLIAAVVLWPFLLIKRRLGRITPRFAAMAALGGGFFAADLALYNTSVLHTYAANATILGNNTPIVVGLLTWFIMQRRPGPFFWMGLTVALCGSALILGTDMRHRVSLGRADLYALAASVCFAGYLFVTERLRERAETTLLLGCSLAASSIFLALYALIAHVPLHVPNAQSWAALLGLGLVSQLAGYLALTYALGHLPATVTSVSLLIQAPLTALLAVPLLREPLTESQVGGGVLVLAGVWIVNRFGHSTTVNVRMETAKERCGP